MRKPFRFKNFQLTDTRSAMKLSTDAVLLGAFARLNGPQYVLDIGTGSGIVSLMLAQRCSAEITGIDIDEGSAADARENFEASPWKDRLHIVRESLQEFAVSCGLKFDVIVCNPPFFENSHPSPYPSRNLSKHTIELTFQELLQKTVTLLDNQGSCNFIIPAIKIKDFQSIAMSHGLHLTRRKWIRPKESKEANRVLLEYRFSNPGNIEESVLVIRGENDDFTGEYRLFTSAFYLNF